MTIPGLSHRRMWGCQVLASLMAAGGTPSLHAQDTTAVQVVNDSLLIRFVDADIRGVVQTLGRYLEKPILVGTLQPPVRVTFETPQPILRDDVRSILKGLVESYNLVFAEDSSFYRVGVQQRDGPTVPASGARGGDQTPQLFVIRLSHARAADVAATVNQLFGGSGGFASPSGFSAGTLSDELRRTTERTMQRPDEPQSTEGSQSGRGAALSGPVTIVPDELTNALLIRASEPDFEVIRNAVEQVDVRPLQVLIQVLIVEVRRGRGFSLGVEAVADSIDLDGAGTLSAFLMSGGLGNVVLEVMSLGMNDIDAVLRLAVSRGDAKIVSRPVVVASNNREARILVGTQRPFVQVSRSLPTETPTRDQVVQYRDVGTELRVIPTINPDGYVSLAIMQQVNNATSETQFDAPVISTREAETEVLVRTGQTVVLGGLREEQHEVIKTGVPLLSSLPVIGGLFGFQDRRTTETELFLFITPTVLADDASADAAAAEALERVRGAGVKIEKPEQR